MIRFFAIVILTAFLFSSCEQKIQFPEGGYKYPATPFKNPKDSFRFSYYGQLLNSKFGESDLSLKAQPDITVRLDVFNGFGLYVIYKMTKNEIIVKKIKSGTVYPEYDMNKLTELEQVHLRILRGNFPIILDSGKLINKRLTNLVDSTPALLRPEYYRYLLDKSITKDSVKFTYISSKVKISDSTFGRIINQINASGYWKLQPFIECDEEYLDGHGFSLEVNTPKQFGCVSLANCPEKAINFSRACQSIVDASKCDLKFKLSNQ